jgi:hypothetical protein
MAASISFSPPGWLDPALYLPGGNIVGGVGAGQPGPNSVGAPAIPDGVWPMGYQGYTKGVLNAGYTGGVTGLTVLNRDWNFTTDGLDLSGFEIRGKVVFAGQNGVTGDGFAITGASGGSTGNAYLETNCHFTGAHPNLKNFTIKPTVTTISINGWMGDEVTLFNFDISQVGGDCLSPNNLHNSLGSLNVSLDWGYCHDQVYFYPDSSHSNGTHNDGSQQPGGTGLTYNRVYLTGITHPTLGQDAALRSNGSGAGQGVLPLGQQNSAMQFTQDVSHISGTWTNCRFGGGWEASVNCYNTASETMGPLIFTNCLWDGNSHAGNDIIKSSTVTLTLSGNKRVDGSAITVSG